MMQKIPPLVTEFIQQQHIVSLASQHLGEIWCANCFYVFDEELVRLIILTNKTTQHGKLMLANPQIAGTISRHTENIREIEGIQFRAKAQLLDDKLEKQQAILAYTAKFPVAKLMKSDVWEIRLDFIKHTTNKLMFAQKTIWQREFT
ncbi:hypothetical protein [Ursidibacter sp. B-7004-1]